MSKFGNVSSSLFGAPFTPNTIEKLIEAKLEDLAVLVANSLYDDSNLIAKKYRRNEVRYGKNNMNDFSHALQLIFPGLTVVTTKMQFENGEECQIELKIAGDALILMKPWDNMNPEVSKILKAKQSAEELRHDGE